MKILKRLTAVKDLNKKKSSSGPASRVHHFRNYGRDSTYQTGKPVQTNRATSILRLMMAHAGKVLTHHFIVQEIWGRGANVQY